MGIFLREPDSKCPVLLPSCQFYLICRISLVGVTMIRFKACSSLTNVQFVYKYFPLSLYVYSAEPQLCQILKLL